MGNIIDKRLLVAALAHDMLIEYMRQNMAQYSSTAGYSYCRFRQYLHQNVSFPSSHK